MVKEQELKNKVLPTDEVSKKTKSKNVFAIVCIACILLIIIVPIFIFGGIKIRNYINDRVSGVEWKFKPSIGEAIEVYPFLSDNLVYLISEEHSGAFHAIYNSCLYALDAKTGQKKWEFYLENNTSAKQDYHFMLSDGIIYIENDGKLYALDAKTGIKKWQFTGSDYVLINKLIYIYGGKDYFYALDAKTGQKKWIVDAKSPFYNFALTNDLVFINSNETKSIYTLDAKTGKLISSFKYPFQYIKKDSYVIITDDGKIDLSNNLNQLYLKDDVVYALDAKTGQEKWKFANQYSESPYISNNLLYFKESIDKTKEAIHAIDIKTGQEKWKFLNEDYIEPISTSNGILVDHAFISDGLLYLNDNNSVYALDAKTGQEKWRFKKLSGSSEDISIGDGLICIGNKDKYIYALDAKTGQEKWKFKAVTGVETYPINNSSIAPVIYNGKLYYNSLDGYLISATRK